MDSFITDTIEKVMQVIKGNESEVWKRMDMVKIIDAVYLKGFTDGEEVERMQGLTRTHRILKGDGKQFVIKRGALDFNSYSKLCVRLGVRLDSDRIDFIGFDVKAFKENGYKFIDPRLKQENICQQAVTLSTP